jgi:hypothetical protein
MFLAVRVIHDPDASIRRIAVRGRPADGVDRDLFERGFGELLRRSAVEFVVAIGLTHARKVSERRSTRLGHCSGMTPDAPSRNDGASVVGESLGALRTIRRDESLISFREGL